MTYVKKNDTEASASLNESNYEKNFKLAQREDNYSSRILIEIEPYKGEMHPTQKAPTPKNSIVSSQLKSPTKGSYKFITDYLSLSIDKVYRLSKSEEG